MFFSVLCRAELRFVVVRCEVMQCDAMRCDAFLLSVFYVCSAGKGVDSFGSWGWRKSLVRGRISCDAWAFCETRGEGETVKEAREKTGSKIVVVSSTAS